MNDLAQFKLYPPREYVPMPADYRPAVMIDSGAYSAFKAGLKTGRPTLIAIEEYADFLLKYEKYLDCYINLDKLEPSDRELGARLSRQNYLYLRQRGLRPMPVYHQGEDIRWLHQMLDDGADYICLASTSAVASAPKEAAWHDFVWNHLVNAGGLPTLKVHGLAETKLHSLRTYPWYSVDSSSWAKQPGAAGAITIQHEGRRFTLSMRHDGKHSRSHRDIATLTGDEREFVIQWMAARGVDFHSLMERKGRDFTTRMFLSQFYYAQLAQDVAALDPRRHRPAGFLHQSALDRPAITLAGVKIFLACWLSNEFSAVFAASRYPYVLASYAYISVAKQRHILDLMGVPESER